MLNMDSDWSKILSTADKSNALNYDKFIEHNQSKGCHRMSKTQSSRDLYLALYKEASGLA